MTPSDHLGRAAPRITPSCGPLFFVLQRPLTCFGEPHPLHLQRSGPNYDALGVDGHEPGMDQVGQRLGLEAVSEKKSFGAAVRAA